MAFPVLEVLAARTGGFAPGQRIELGERLRIGRGREAELTLQSGNVSRSHCGVFHEHGGWWLRDLGSTNGVLVDGVQVHELELEHGTIFEVARGYVFRFLTQEQGELRSEEMETAIRERPADERRWQVYADWLQEHGGPLGDAPSERRWLGPFAGDAVRGELQVEWLHGLPRRLVMRSFHGDHYEWTWQQRLECLRRAPGLRLVRELELDLGSFLRTDVQDDRPLRAALGALGDALPLLERLIITPARSFPVAELQGRFEVQLRPWRPASIAVVELRPMAHLRLVPVGSLAPPMELSERDVRPLPPSARLVFTGSIDRVLTLRQTPELWELDRESSGPAGLISVNGVTIGRCFVRSGDVIEVVPGVTLRFSA